MWMALIASAVMIALGLAVTFALWPSRAQTRIRRILWGMWILISLALLVILVAAFTSIGVLGLYAYDNFTDILQVGLNIPAPLVKLIAVVGAVVALYGATRVFSFNRGKRWSGVAIVGSLAAAFFLVSWLWGSKNGYVIQLDGRAKRCANPGGIDQSTRQQCHPMTAPMLRLFKRSAEEEPLVIEKNPLDPVLFDVETGEAVRWVCERGDGNLWLARAPIYDPWTGRRCEPVEEDDQRIRQRLDDLIRKAEATRREEEHRRAEREKAEQARRVKLAQEEHERITRAAVAERVREAARKAEAAAPVQHVKEARQRAGAARGPKIYRLRQPLAITDGSEAEAHIQVPDKFLIRELRVGIELDEAKADNTSCWLVKDDARVAIGHTGQCRGGGYCGCQSSVHEVDKFDGLASAGDWKLLVKGMTGWVESFSMTMMPVVDNDGIVVRPSGEAPDPKDKESGPAVAGSEPQN